MSGSQTATNKEQNKQVILVKVLRRLQTVLVRQKKPWKK